MIFILVFYVLKLQHIQVGTISIDFSVFNIKIYVPNTKYEYITTIKVYVDFMADEKNIAANNIMTLTKL